jgi:malate dehydrogenase
VEKKPLMTNFSSPAYRSTRVSIIGVGNVGGTLAQRIAEKNLADVVLLDVLPGRPQGIALDLSQSSGIELHNRQIIGTTDYAETHGSDIVVITAGLPRKPGMSRDDLLRTNAEIVTHAAKQAIAYSPDALLIVITNPLDVMTYLAWQASGLPPQRVMGMAGILDSTRFQTFIAMELGISPADVRAMVLGSHGDLMVPLPNYSTVNGIPIASLLSAAAIDRLIDRTRHGGAEVVELLKTGGAYYAPASSACLMVEAILLNQPRILPVAAYLQGEYGLRDLYLGVPVKLGCGGVEQIFELELTQVEQEGLEQSASAVRESLSHVLASS